MCIFRHLVCKKTTIQNARKMQENFVIFSEIMLDILINRWYIIKARVGKLRVHCDDAGDCGLAGNFRGVCPVIGRLNCLSALAYIAAPG